MKNICLVEDDIDLKDGLELIINSDSQYTCLGAFTTFESLLADEACLNNAEIVLADINLPGMSGIEGIKIIREKYPKITPIVLTVMDNANVIFEALRSGASSYVLKTDAPNEIINILDIVNNGGAYMSPNVAIKVATYFANEEQLIRSKLEVLTQRETEIVSFLKLGHRYQDIADRMFISIDTVRYHIKNIYQKLEVNSKVEAINFLKQ